MESPNRVTTDRTQIYQILSHFYTPVFIKRMEALLQEQECVIWEQTVGLFSEPDYYDHYLFYLSETSSDYAFTFRVKKEYLQRAKEMAKQAKRVLKDHYDWEGTELESMGDPKEINNLPPKPIT